MDGGNPPLHFGAADLLGLMPYVTTPCYIYDVDAVRGRLWELRSRFADRFDISYAVKANPNQALLAAIEPHVQGYDVSSFAEAERVLRTGTRKPISFTGPGKRDEELRRFAAAEIGEIIIESIDEAETLSAIVQRERLPSQRVVLRINPQYVPRHFGASMSGKSSQFGIDEEEVAPAIDALLSLPGLRLVGFHCYSATNCLKAAAVAENFESIVALFRRCVAHAGIRPEVLIFGSGFGIPYVAGDEALDLDAVAAVAVPLARDLQAEPTYGGTRLVLELGRWIVGPAGTLLTTVIRCKTSRGTSLRICDAGFNANMAACGMLGGAFRRNWPIANLSNPHGPPEECDVVGPLCTTLDHVATRIVLPQVRKGDVLAIAASGAYGVTASPTRFISHPEPSEFLLSAGRIEDVTESRLNWWAPATAPATVPA